MSSLLLQVVLNLLVGFLLPGSVSSSCTCSPFSGNLGTCCSGKSKDTCGSAFHKATCGAPLTTCCTSDFGSACCAPGSSCSPGCRNSLKGGCGCVSSLILWQWVSTLRLRSTYW